MALDVTEERIAQVRAQAEVRGCRARSRAWLSLALWDRQGRLALCNQNFRRFFALAPRLLKPGASRQSVERIMRLAFRQEQFAASARRREVELAGRPLGGDRRAPHQRRRLRGHLRRRDVTALKQQEETRRLNEEQLQRAVVGLECSRVRSG